MNEPITLPRLELADADSSFDEAVITINGREEETIIVACNGSRELAEKLVRYINAHARVIQTLQATADVLGQIGDPVPEIDELIKIIGEAA